MSLAVTLAVASYVATVAESTTRVESPYVTRALPFRPGVWLRQPSPQRAHYWTVHPRGSTALWPRSSQHGGIRFAVIIGGIPEKESDPAFVLRGQHLGFDIFR